MPSSQYLHISDVLQAVHRTKPRSILDIGCGYGRWGILFREILDVLHARYHKDDWITRIDGVEIFDDYIKPYHHYFYDRIFIADIRDHIEQIDKYDLIMAGDVIEHFPMEIGQQIIGELRQKSQALIVAVPLGDWPQGEVLGNVHETHQAIWSREKIEELRPDTMKYYQISRPDDYAVLSWGLKIPGATNCQANDDLTRLIRNPLRFLRRLTGRSGSAGNR